MTQHDLASPSAAERYFDASLFGELYRLMAAGLGSHAGPRTASRRVEGHAIAETTGRPGIVERLDRWFWRQEQKAREAYLASSTDVFDLERRIRALERGVITRYY